MKRGMAAVVLLLWVQGELTGQQERFRASVERLETALKQMRELGRLGDRALGKARRAHREAAWVYGALRRALEETEPAPGVTVKDVEPRVRNVTKALRAVMDLGMGVGPALQSRIGALEAEVAAAEGKAKSALGFLAATLRRTKDALVAHEARRAIAAQGGGIYLGMWEAQRRERALYLEGFRLLLEDIAAPEGERVLAADAIGQLTRVEDEDERSRMISVCRGILGSKSPVPPKSVRDAAVFALARLGERGPLLERVRPILKTLSVLARGEAPDANRILALQFELASLYMGAYEYENATRAYAPALGILYQNVTFQRTGAEGRGEIANALYNLACTLARSHHSEKALAILDQAFAWGLRSFAWCRKDGDLKSLHADGALERVVSPWEKGERRPGEGILSAAEYLSLMAPFLPDGKPSKKRESEKR